MMTVKKLIVGNTNSLGDPIMITLKLFNRATGEIFIVMHDTYGIIVQRFIALSKAISEEWILYCENRLGHIVRTTDEKITKLLEPQGE